MHVTMVHVYVKQAYIHQFMTVSALNQQASMKEKGNCRFDILQSPSDASYFILYEAYQAEEDMIAHKKTAHYLIWRETVADWMAKPRQGVVFQSLSPQMKG